MFDEVVTDSQWSCLLSAPRFESAQN